MFRFWMTLVLLMALAVCFAGTTGKITGHVTDTAGNKLAKASVAVYQGTKSISTVQTTNGGSYIVSNLKPGTYTVKFKCTGYNGAVAEKVVVAADKATISNIKLAKLTTSTTTTTGKLNGKVEDASGNALGYVNISVRKGDKTITGVQSKPNGTYTILNIPPGEYSVKFSLVGYAVNLTEKVVIKVGAVTTLNAILQKSTISQKALGATQLNMKIDPGKAGSLKETSINSIGDVAVSDVNEIIAMQNGVSSVGGELHVRGGRANDLNYTIDGMSVSDPVGGVVVKRVEETVVIVPDINIPPAEYARIQKMSKDPWGCRYIHNYMPPPPPPPVQYNAEDYAKVVENVYKYSTAEPLSTFSIDVDTAGYSNIRRLINGGSLPEKGYVRIEELLNYFDYNYPQPKDQHPFAVYSELGACPWSPKHQLLHIGLQGKDVDYSEAPASNLVFLLDVSGSMSDANKLPLVKEAMKLLVKQMRPQDRVAIVTYASNTGVALQSTFGSNKSVILNAIDKLNAGGSTAGGAGIQLAYEVAQEHMFRGGNNRIILCTDGDFNVGASSDAAMQQLITEKRQAGIFLTVLGFGMGNIKDNKMEILADKGNGNYAYIDNLIEAQKVLVKEMGGTLFTIAKDVKLQLEFNPAQVRAYRLIGYENRALKAEDFNNDKIDAGELGAGHTVTALYELIPASSDESIDGIDPLKYQKVNLTDDAINGEELLTLKLRYKKPDSDNSIMMVKVIKNLPITREMKSENFRFSAAVAGFGLLLKDSRYKGNASWEQVIDLASGAVGKDPDGYRREFIALSEQARDIMHYQHQPYKNTNED